MLAGRSRVVVLGGLLAGAVAWGGAPTGQTSEIVVAPRLLRLEDSLPRGGSYERALRAARAAQYRRAAELFLAVVGELHQAAGAGHLGFPRSRTLVLKAHAAAAAARRLAEAEREDARLPPGDRRVREAESLHLLYLTSSASLGSSDGVLFERAARLYRSIVAEGGPYWPRAELGYAGLLAAAGRRREAAAEFARLPPSGEILGAAELSAGYFAWTGQRSRALRVLSDLRDADPEWPRERAFLRASNHLDPLRDDPRFVGLLGADE